MDNCQLSISGRPSRGSQHSAFAIPRIQQSNHLAYVIYTSGSTGKPKAVPIMHANICPLLHWGYKQLGIGTGDRALQNLSYYFDWSVWEIFIILTTGASLYIAPEDVLFNPEACGGFIDNNKITVLHATPTQYRFLLNLGQRFETLKYLFLGAEKLTFEMVESSFASVNNRCRVFNMYGPTEATIIAAVLEIQREYKNPGLSSVPIGIPVGNNQLFILNKYNQLCPIDVNGELYIEGGGVAMGYLNNPELTAEKFKFNRSYESNKTYIFYKTGDLTHWLPDGGIEFLGRIDQQVKIRGMRIELGEIESRLLTYPGIKEAVILSRDDEHHGNYLCAYIITNKALNILELREYLAKELPPYMIPSHFMYLDSLPLNPNGKIDREALPKPPKECSLSEKTYVAPESNVEKIIADIWKQVLKIDKVGINDNFFDLGGNSFTIIRLSNKLKDAFKKEIPVAALFNYPTIASQSEYLSGREFVKQDAQQQTLPVEVEKMGMDIAVIGMAGRFPGARNIDQFWTNIKEGVESITFFIDEELETMGVDLELIKNPNYVKAKGVLEHIEYFDPDLFDYSTREAELMDPQFRIMHECVYEALEDAGYDPQNYNSGIGLYVGSYFNSIWMRQLYTEITSHSGLLGIESLNESNYLSTRIAYKLNLKGPAVTIQTACSTSLVAIDAACQSLLSGKCKIALAGGITITLQDQAGYLYEEGMVRSPDGHCRPFDAEAKGTIGGNGAAVVVLKPLADAIADGDHIRAVVKGSATNNDGSRKVGYTAPSVEGQAEAIRAAHAAAGITPETITYVETHGTGTALGDPIEIEALKKAFGTTKKHYCRLGTLKANIGHLDAAAGVVGFIKTVLALEHRELPPAINVRVTNPQIDFENSPFYITDKLDKWENENHPLRAGVSSFGIGGTNAHVVLEEAPKIQPPGTGKDKKLIILSAKTKNSLERACFNLAQHLIQNPGINLSDAAYTLQVGRKAFTHRRTVVGSTSSEFINALTHPAGNPAVSTATCEGSSKHIIFMFSGQGSQYENMGLGLYHTEPVFREEMNRAFEILRSLTSYDIKAILYPALANESYRANITIDQTEIAQPVLFAIEYALAKLLISWGIKPHAMIGHSIGEYTAACLAGVFSLQEALTLVVSRGKLMQEMPAGSMLSVPLPKEEVEPLLKSFHNLSLAAVNSSSLCVISGPNDAVDAFTALLKERGQPSTRLHTSHAFHSHMMEPMLASFREKVKDITLKPPISPYISNTTGYWITVEQAINPQYWVNHVRETVYFNEGLTELLKDANAVLVEIGPGNVLSTFARKHKDRSDQQPVISLL
ncbi:MAG TPA: beta-ketoacyl synthase N-terminal-like domain-containing protein, partial [Candidatus Deferrimicrobium sp.]|nr:beta-ketoacyl synthase N-terminal-like domain-containing protein [Candidatus Deferrimicrobium sp.]